MEDIIPEIQRPADIISLTADIALPEMPDFALKDDTPEGDIFSAKARKAWDKTEEARCDFQYHLRLTRRASTSFVSIWQKSIFGRTLTEIKGDDNMVPYFVKHLLPVIQEMVGYNLSSGDWALVTTPMRRHKDLNFASRIAMKLADSLCIPFYYDCAHCRTKQRVNAVFGANNIPKEKNVIVVDDFVTTGSTLLAMKKLLQAEGKNPVFFCGINNKI
jgi:hypothetical protein